MQLIEQKESQVHQPAPLSETTPPLKYSFELLERTKPCLNIGFSLFYFVTPGLSATLPPSPVRSLMCMLQ